MGRVWGLACKLWGVQGLACELQGVWGLACKLWGVWGLACKHFLLESSFYICMTLFLCL